MKRTIALLFFSVTMISCHHLEAQYTLNEAFPDLPSFSLPIDMKYSPDGTGRIFIVEQRGRIYVFDTNSSVSSHRLFLDLSGIVSQTGSETGLLGLAFHPDFSQNGYFFVDYTSSREGRLRSYISRFQASPVSSDSALSSSETILLELDQPYSNHNGGCLVFGPDRFLYITFGDGGSAGDPQNNAQNRSTLLGKILRINVDSASGQLNYSIPVSNPYYGNPNGYREEIFAYGLRNPWRMSFDRTTGTLWTADVGQNTWEEIDTITSGGNYGWRLTEGFECYNPSSGCDTTGLIMPLWVYDHSANDRSITGGYVYRGSALPGLSGKYIYADYVSGRIWALTTGGTATVTNQLLIDSPYLISSFGEDGQGEMYILSYEDGRIYRLEITASSLPSGGNTEPSGFLLDQNYPNPFSARGRSASGGNPTTTIQFHTSDRTQVRLSVYTVEGREIALLYDGPADAGRHAVVFDAAGLPSGAYFYRLQSGDFSAQKAMTVVK